MNGSAGGDVKTALCLSLALLLTGGCSVAYPTQWNARATSAENVDATPWVVYANTPTSWESRDGQIQLRSTRHERLSGMGLYRLDLEFEVELVGPSGRIITCRTEPTGPDVALRVLVRARGRAAALVDRPRRGLPVEGRRSHADADEPRVLERRAHLRR